jgi:hypothetical protein
MKERVLFKLGQYFVLPQRSSNSFERTHEGAIETFVTNITTRKLLDARYWWLMLFKDANGFCRSCDACQRT